MGQPYIGEIRMFGGSFAPVGWSFCDGSLLPISEYDTLFTVIGTTYGGDGETTFGLPNLNGRAPLHQGTLKGNTYTIGESAGVENVTLTTQTIPIHNHQVIATSNISNQTDLANNVLAQSSTGKLYIEDNPTAALSNLTVGPAGGSQPHENMQPYLCVSFIISLFGLFPSQT
jgi:microcystin-dependent protein